MTVSDLFDHSFQERLALDSVYFAESNSSKLLASFSRGNSWEKSRAVVLTSFSFSSCFLSEKGCPAACLFIPFIHDKEPEVAAALNQTAKKGYVILQTQDLLLSSYSWSSSVAKDSPPRDWHPLMNGTLLSEKEEMGWYNRASQVQCQPWWCSSLLLRVTRFSGINQIKASQFLCCSLVCSVTVFLISRLIVVSMHAVEHHQLLTNIFP